MVLAENVHKRFGRTEVLLRIDLVIEPGSVCCILGASGSGKSTFLRCINHLEKIDSGRLSVDDELVGYRRKGDKLHELSPKEVARTRASIGMVFQRFNLFPHMTALENIIEAPLLGCSVRTVPRRRSVQRSFSNASASPTGPRATRPHSREDSSSASPSPARSACGRS